MILLILINNYVFGIVGIFLFGANDRQHWGSLAKAMMSVWQVETLDGWDNIMYVNMYGCERYGYPFTKVECQNPRAFGWISALYFCSLILVGAWMLPTVIIGITTIAFAESTEELKEEYVQLEIGQQAMEKAAALFDKDPIPVALLPQLHTLYRRLAEEQVRGKLVEFKIDTTEQAEANSGIRAFVMRPFLKFVTRDFATGLRPPNRKRVSVDRINQIIATACGVREAADAKCKWPVFLFIINFVKCTTDFKAAPAPDDGGDDGYATDDETTASARAATKKKTGALRNVASKAKAVASKLTFWEKAATGEILDEALKGVGDAVEGVLDAEEIAEDMAEAAGRDLDLPVDQVEALANGAPLSPVSADPQAYCGGFVGVDSDQVICADNSQQSSAFDIFSPQKRGPQSAEAMAARNTSFWG